MLYPATVDFSFTTGFEIRMPDFPEIITSHDYLPLAINRTGRAARKIVTADPTRLVEPTEAKHGNIMIKVNILED